MSHIRQTLKVCRGVMVGFPNGELTAKVVRAYNGYMPGTPEAFATIPVKPVEAPPPPVPPKKAETAPPPTAEQKPPETMVKEGSPAGTHKEAADPTRGELEKLAEGQTPEQQDASAAQKEQFDISKLEAPEALKTALAELQAEIKKLDAAIGEARTLSGEEVEALISTYNKSNSQLAKSEGMTDKSKETITSYLKAQIDKLEANKYISKLPEPETVPVEPSPETVNQGNFSREAIAAYLKQLGVADPTAEDVSKALDVINKAFAPESKTRKYLKYGAAAVFVSLLLCQFVAGMDQQSGGGH